MRSLKIFAATLVAGSALLGANAHAADVKAGEKTFKTKCRMCHQVKPGKNAIGPSLFGVIGRKAGTAEGYRYSKAMKKHDVTWNDKTLDTYLEAPREVVKGTKMAFPGLKKKSDRENVIAYLKTLK